MDRKILFKPMLKKGQGSGHLRRAVELLRSFGPHSALLIQECGLEVADVLTDLGVRKDQIRYALDSGERWDLIVVDQRVTQANELEMLIEYGVPIALDGGGPGRAYFPFLIDCLPGNTGQAPNAYAASQQTPNAYAAPRQTPNADDASQQIPNAYAAPGQTSSLERGKKQPSFKKVLLSFGGEDPMELSQRLLARLLSAGLFIPQDITVVQGPFFRNRSWPAGIGVLKAPQTLAKLLPEYDLLFTSYGLTCFEALSAGVPVILLNPSRYHRRISRRCGLPVIGVVTPRIRSLKRLIRHPELLFRVAEVWHKKEQKEQPEQLIGTLRPAGNWKCPACAAGGNPATARFTRRTYYRCNSCTLIYLMEFSEEKKAYDRSYFFSEYQVQYGKTYLEDFDAIKEMSRERLRVLETLRAPLPPTPRSTERSRGRLLDVGCAYGPFLAAAREMGYTVSGIDISQAAVRYVRETLHLPCEVGDFESLPNLPLPENSLDVVSFWYVLEHFLLPARVLTRANRLLTKGGFLAFSTPNGAGVSSRRNRRAFLQASPQDHYSVWQPHAARRILPAYGFTVRRVRITGHHPERFPGSRSWNEPAFRRMSQMLGWGDTFEIYAEKVRDV